jgi:hypothetical protein
MVYQRFYLIGMILDVKTPVSLSPPYKIQLFEMIFNSSVVNKFQGNLIFIAMSEPGQVDVRLLLLILFFLFSNCLKIVVSVFVHDASVFGAEPQYRLIDLILQQCSYLLSACIKNHPETSCCPFGVGWFQVLEVLTSSVLISTSLMDYHTLIESLNNNARSSANAGLGESLVTRCCGKVPSTKAGISASVYPIADSPFGISSICINRIISLANN